MFIIDTNAKYVTKCDFLSLRIGGIHIYCMYGLVIYYNLQKQACCEYVILVNR